MPRTRLTADLTVWVAAAGGSDANVGTDPAAPLATINYAVGLLCDGYDPAGYQMTIRLLPDPVNKHGTVVLKNYFDAGVDAQKTNARILGDPAHPELYQIEATPGQPAAVLAVGVHTTWLVEGVKLTHPAWVYGIEADFYSKIYVRSVAFGNCGAHAIAVFGSVIEFLTNGAYPLYTVTGVAATSLMADMQSQIIVQGGASIVFSGGPSLTSAFADVKNGSMIYFGGTCGGAVNVNRKYVCDWRSGIQGSAAMPLGFLPSAPANGSYAN